MPDIAHEKLENLRSKMMFPLFREELFLITEVPKDWKVCIVLFPLGIEMLNSVQSAGLLEINSLCWSTWDQFTLLVCLRSVFTRVGLVLTEAPPQLSVCYLWASVMFPCIISPCLSSSFWDLTNPYRGKDDSQKSVPLWIFNVLRSWPYDLLSS